MRRRMPLRRSPDDSGMAPDGEYGGTVEPVAQAPTGALHRLEMTNEQLQPVASIPLIDIELIDRSDP